MEPLEVLSPELQNALDTLKPVPTPDPAFMAAGRAAFLAEAQDFAAQAVSLAPEHRHKEWKARLKALLTFQWREAPMFTMIKLFLVASLMVGGTVGTVDAAQNSLPGGILYPLKLQLETMEMQRIQDPEEIVEQAMVLMQTRVNEARRLAEQDDVIPPEVGEHYEAHLELALQTMEQLGEPARTQLQTTLAIALADQTRDMDRIRECLQDATCDGDPDMVQTMLKLMERTRDHLETPEVPPEEDDEQEPVDDDQEPDNDDQGPDNDDQGPDDDDQGPDDDNQGPDDDDQGPDDDDQGPDDDDQGPDNDDQGPDDDDQGSDDDDQGSDDDDQGSDDNGQGPDDDQGSDDDDQGSDDNGQGPDDDQGSDDDDHGSDDDSGNGGKD